MAGRITIYDTTLRDGSQGEEVLFSVDDKLRIARRLDELGVDYIEGGWPGANPKDGAFFAAARQLGLHHARLAAFGSTRRADTAPGQDKVLHALLKAETGVITIFGKSWDLHVTRALAIPLEQNLVLIEDSIRYLKERVDTVFYDAEHFFDGYRANPDYAMATLQAAVRGGADALVLCDTNGGSLPEEVARLTGLALALGRPLGIHCHNDADLAVANTLAAVAHGAVQVQGTVNGLGERCGNANLVSILPNLMLKMGCQTGLDAARLQSLTAVSRFVDEMANVTPRRSQPYVGHSAFAHKGGIHVSAVLKEPATYEHIRPELVGNRQRVLVSDQAGRSNLVYKLQEFGIEGVAAEDQRMTALLAEVKHLEHSGYQFDGAEASFELRVRRALGQVPDHFELQGFRVLDERRVTPGGHWALVSDASVKVRVGRELEHTAAEGNGPLNALDKALRKALLRFYPTLREMELIDFKVRILSGDGTAAKVRVLIESRDGLGARWGTVGVSDNIIAASYEALVDAVEFKLLKDQVPAPPGGGKGGGKSSRGRSNETEGE